MNSAPTFRGPGDWRSQAAAARLDANVFAQMADMHRRLLDKGLNEAAAMVAQASDQARAGFTDRASMTLRQAANQLGAEAPGYAQGAREIAEEVATDRPGLAPAADEDIPDTGEPSL